MSDKDLASRHCAPCNAETPPLEGPELQVWRGQIHPSWSVLDEHHLSRTFEFGDFAGALSFTNRVGDIADAEGHHPEICVTWGQARVKIWTHVIDGLSENDFILAAKIDRLTPSAGG